MFEPQPAWSHALAGAILLLSGCTSNGAPGSSFPVDDAAHSEVNVSFSTEDGDLAGAVDEYEQLWAEEGDRIVRAMESISGLRFVKPDYADTAIVAHVVEAPSNSGYRDRPMRLRASYPADTKRATLVHELGHRLQTHMFSRNEEEHGPLFLWVYDVWVDLWGQTFADEQVSVEKRRGERYVQAWDFALQFTREERSEAWRRLVAERSEGR